MTHPQESELPSHLGEKLVSLSELNNRLLTVISHDMQENKVLQTELRLTIKNVSHTVEELKNIIHGHGDRESLPMLMQRLNLELHTLTTRVDKLEAANEESNKAAIKESSRVGERVWQVMLSLAPAVLFAILVVVYMVMNIVYPDVANRVHQVTQPAPIVAPAKP